jgi:hypothetical protein
VFAGPGIRPSSGVPERAARPFTETITEVPVGAQGNRRAQHTPVAGFAAVEQSARSRPNSVGPASETIRVGDRRHGNLLTCPQVRVGKRPTRGGRLSLRLRRWPALPFFGCEADDPLVPEAFGGEENPLGVQLSALFGSDVGHWEVPDSRRVLLGEAVERGLMTDRDFRSFVYDNARQFFGGRTPRSSPARRSPEAATGSVGRRPWLSARAGARTP